MTCPVQDIIFNLKEEFTDPHTVKIMPSFSGKYVQVIVTCPRKQKIIFAPCGGNGKSCEECAEFPEKKPMSMKFFTSKKEEGGTDELRPVR